MYHSQRGKRIKKPPMQGVWIFSGVLNILRGKILRQSYFTEQHPILWPPITLKVGWLEYFDKGMINDCCRKILILHILPSVHHFHLPYLFTLSVVKTQQLYPSCLFKNEDVKDQEGKRKDQKIDKHYSTNFLEKYWKHVVSAVFEAPFVISNCWLNFQKH